MPKNRERGENMATDDIGTLAVRIAMDDSTFQQGMRNLKSQMGVIDSSFKESVAGLKDWGSNLDGLKSNAQALGDKINVQKQIVQTYQEQLDKSKTNLENNSKAMMDLKSKVDSAKSAWEQSKAALGANDEATLKLKKDYDDLNKQYADSENKVRNNAKTVDGYTVQVNNASAKLKNMETALGDVNKKIDESEKSQSLFGKATEKMGLNLENVKTAFGAIGIAAGGFLKSAVDSATGAQKSTQQLTNLLENQGVSAGQASKDIKDFTGAITKMSDYSGGEAKAALQALAQKGIAVGDAMKQESTLANVAAGTNSSLSDAANLVADAYHGKMKAMVSLGIVTQQEIKNNTAAQKVEQLQTDMEDKIKGKYGDTAIAAKLLSDMYNHKTQSLVDAGIATKAESKTLDDASKTALSMTDIQDRLNKRFGGAAQADLNSYAGQMKQMQNQLNAAKTQIGTALIPVLAQLATALAQIITPITNFIQQNPQFTAAILSITAVVGTLVGGLSVVNMLAGVFAPLATAMTGVEVASASLILPIIGVVAAITAVAAIAFVVYKNWGTITNFFKGIWTSLVGIFDGIKNTIVGTWNNIISTVGNIIMGFKNTIVNIFNGMRTAIFIVWNGIKAVIMAIVMPLVSGVVNIFNDMKAGLTTILNGLKTFFTGIWELIKTVTLGPVLLLIDLVTGNFGKLSSDAQGIFNNLKNALGMIFGGLRDIVVGIVQALAGFLGGLWNSIVSIAVGAWNGLRSGVISIVSGLVSGAIGIFNGIVSFFWNLPGTLYNAGASIFNALRNGIMSVLGTIGGAIAGGFNSAISFITSLPGKALQWGKDFIDGLINGIKGAIGGVVNAVSGVADKIRSFLHFSVPDEGPLTDYESWMPDFMKGLTQGIEKNKSLVTNAIKNLATDVNIGMKLNPAAAGAGSGSTSVNSNGIITASNIVKQALQIQLVLQNGKAIAEYIVDDINTLQGDKLQISARRQGL